MAPVTRARAKAAQKSPKIKASRVSAPQPKRKVPKSKRNATKNASKKAASPAQTAPKPAVVTPKFAKTPKNTRPRKKGKGRANARPSSDDDEIVYAPPPLADSIGAHLANDPPTASFAPRIPMRTVCGTFGLPPPRVYVPGLHHLGPGGRGPAPPDFSPLAGPGRRPGGRSRRTPEIPVFGPGSPPDASPISPADDPRRGGVVRTPECPIYGPGDIAGSRPYRSPPTPALGAVEPAGSVPRRRMTQDSPTHRPERRAARPPPTPAGLFNPAGRPTRIQEPSSHTLSPGPPPFPPLPSTRRSSRRRNSNFSFGPGPPDAIYSFPHLMDPITPREFQHELRELTDHLVTDPAEVNEVRQRLERRVRRERAEREAREQVRRMSRPPSRVLEAMRAAADHSRRFIGNGRDAQLVPSMTSEERRHRRPARRRGRRSVAGPTRRPGPAAALPSAIEEMINRRAARVLARDGTRALLNSTSGAGLGMSGV